MMLESAPVVLQSALPTMVEAFSIAFRNVFSWPAVAFLLVGTLVGLVFGMFPGLGGPVALALLIPVSFGMDQSNAIILFGGAMGGVTFGGSITAILIGTPGTAPNAATMFDGYPLAQQGRAGEAIGVSAVSSALGALIGLVFLVLLIPVSREVVLAFQPPEFFWLAIVGLTVIAAVTTGAMVKGLVSGGLGLMASFVGWSSVTSTYRYGFGTDYLWDGFDIIVALLGIFAVAELIRLAAEDRSIAKGEVKATFADTMTGVKAALVRWPLIVRSGIIGTVIGIVPGAGGTVATFIGYMGAQMTSDDPDSFGTGNIEGIIGSEAANDAKDGGALLPTVVFSVPGSAVMVVLLGAFLLHGITPGQALLTEDLPILATLIVALLFANLFTSTIGILTANNLAKITQIPTRLVIPVILAVVFVGGYMLRNNVIDLSIVLMFGLIGYWMVVFGYSRVAFVLGLILGPIAERGFHQSLAISDTGPLIFVTRPISFVLLVVAVVSLLLPFVRERAKGGLLDG